MGFLKGVTLSNTGIRKYFGTSNYQAYVMCSRHVGDFLLDCSVESPLYSVNMMNSGWTVDNIPFIDAAATATQDSVFISLVNRHISDSILLKLNWDFQTSSDFGKVYELSASHYLVANDEYNPYRIIPREKLWKVSNELMMPPHSFIIIAIPSSDAVGISKNIDDSTHFSIYPNPFTRYLNFKVNRLDSKFKNIYIYNLLGSIIYSQSINPDSEVQRINTDFLDNGIYILKIEIGTKHYFTTLIKN